MKADRKRAEEIKHRLISLSFNFEDSDGITHVPWVSLEDAIKAVEEFASLPVVTDEEIKIQRYKLFGNGVITADKGEYVYYEDMINCFSSLQSIAKAEEKKILVPTDEEIIKACPQEYKPRLAAWIQGAKWMRERIAGAGQLLNSSS